MGRVQTMSAIDLSRFLHKRAKALNLSATVIASRAGISRQTWYRLLNADVKQARISTLMRVADALQVSLVELACLYHNNKRAGQTGLIHTAQDSDAYVFIRDVTYPLNSMVGKGECFEKTWEIINVGNTAWVDRQLICVDDAFDMRITCSRNASHATINEQNWLKPRQKRIAIPFTSPGEHVLLSVHFRAPKIAGTLISVWKSIDANGHYCFPQHRGLSCQVRVVERQGKRV